MIPPVTVTAGDRVGAPRVSGDDPEDGKDIDRDDMCSPRERG